MKENRQTKRKKARRKKLRRKVDLRERRINKRKYYGTGVLVDRYKEVIQNSLDIDAAIDTLKDINISTEESTVDDVVMLLGSQMTGADLLDMGAIAQVGNIMEESYEKGTRRLYDTEGERVEPPEDLHKQDVEALKREQRDYFENMAEDAVDTMEDDLKKGIEEGESIDDIAKNIEDDLDNMTKNRSETIARSEVIKASSKGTETTMKEAGVERVIWLATMDDRTCEVCEDFHETIWDTDNDNKPMPVEDTHPNCRCTWVADVE